MEGVEEGVAGEGEEGGTGRIISTELCSRLNGTPPLLCRNCVILLLCVET